MATGSDRGAIAVEDIGHWIRSQRRAGRAEVGLFSPSAPEDAALFRIVFARFVEGFGGPDDSACEVAEMFAAWDFDYYRLSLRVEPRGVVLALDRGGNADGDTE